MKSTIESFTTALRDAGITTPVAITGDAGLHRFHIEGDKTGTLNGWYVLHLDGRPAGAFGHWKTGQTHIWKANNQYTPMTAAEKSAFKAQRRKIEAERQRNQQSRHSKAADKAIWIWRQSTTAPFLHPYLIKKRVLAHNARLYKGALVVPLYDNQLQLVNLQFISANGEKRFLSGGRKSGCFFVLGDLNADDHQQILIVEGYATGATLHELTGHATVVAFDAGNLKPVAEVVRNIAPNAEIIICGDNDASGVGQAKARQAALAAKCKYIVPPTVGDFNDHYAGV
ncbi:MAG: toprim domain-containing protein [Methylobacter sp.]|nr:toprim domain-containing protein [Methylobacter sp.]